MLIENGYVVLEDGIRLRAICGGGEGMGAGGGGGAGGMQAAGAGSNIDFTFGQGKVYDDKTKREMAMLKSLIDASAGRSPGVNTGQTPGAAQFKGGWDPGFIQKLLLSFRG